MSATIPYITTSSQPTEQDKLELCEAVAGTTRAGRSSRSHDGSAEVRVGVEDGKLVCEYRLRTDSVRSAARMALCEEGSSARS